MSKIFHPLILYVGYENFLARTCCFDFWKVPPSLPQAHPSSHTLDNCIRVFFEQSFVWSRGYVCNILQTGSVWMFDKLWTGSRYKNRPVWVGISSPLFYRASCQNILGSSLQALDKVEGRNIHSYMKHKPQVFYLKYCYHYFYMGYLLSVTSLLILFKMNGIWNG